MEKEIAARRRGNRMKGLYSSFLVMLLLMLCQVLLLPKREEEGCELTV